MNGAVVTGPTGTVGTALVKELISSGYHVLLILHRGSCRRRALDTLLSDCCRIVETDLCDYGSLTENVRDFCDGDLEYEAFFHLAWMGTSGPYRNDLQLQTRNIEYALDAVALAHAMGCKVFIGAGSQAEYGRMSSDLRSDTPVFPENGYGMAKLCAGQMTREYCHQLGMRHEWARILSVYGPNDGEGSLISTAVSRMLAGVKTSFTGGEQIWDYLYSKDAARALRLIAEKGRDGSVYVLGSGQARPLADYIRIIADKTGYQQPIGLGEIPYAASQVMYLKADISELAADTGFQPEVSFEEGIQAVIDSVRAQKEIILN